MGRFLVRNFGCRATQADGAALESLLEAQGYRAVNDAAEADLVILNTCTVTAAADGDARHAVRRVHRENPQARILVTGCYAQRAPQELSRLPGVHWVVGNSHKTLIPGILAEDRAPGAPYHGQIHIGDIASQRDFLTAPVEDAAGDRTRPNLKIQDGCDNPCTFCVIPAVRGRSRSAPLEQVIEQVRALGSRYREVVLSGINLGRWGRDLPYTDSARRPRLAHLLKRLLEETPVARIRLSSVEPMDFSDELLELMAASPRLARHVHAPLQTGADSLLRRMKRRYRARHYAERIRRARELMPDAAIGADVMVGFPGESEAEFEDNRRFIDSLPFTYLHVFTYSERPGTPASRYDGRVPMRVRQNRNRILRELAAAKNLEFRRCFLGRTLSVVTLAPGTPALSDNYLKVELARARSGNQIVDVEIGGLAEQGLRERGALGVLR